MTAVLVDVEQPVRDWLRTMNLTGVGSRVYVGIPTGAAYPLLDVQLLDGGIQPSATPLAVPLFTFSVWGDNRSQRGTVKDAAWALADLLQDVGAATLTGCVLLDAQVVLGPVPRFDPDGAPRYLLDAALTIRVDA